MGSSLMIAGKPTPTLRDTLTGQICFNKAAGVSTEEVKHDCEPGEPKAKALTGGSDGELNCEPAVTSNSYHWGGVEVAPALAWSLLCWLARNLHSLVW